MSAVCVPSTSLILLSGYKMSPFPLKATQQAQVSKILSETGFMPPELVVGEVDWFYNHLGIGECTTGFALGATDVPDNIYFLAESPDAIADHILALYSAKLLAYTKHDPNQLVIDLEKIIPEGEPGKEGAVWIHTSQPGVTVKTGPGASVEKRYVQLIALFRALPDAHQDRLALPGQLDSREGVPPRDLPICRSHLLHHLPTAPLLLCHSMLIPHLCSHQD